MCGICGFIGPDEGPLDFSAGRAMRDVLWHRGPDGAGEAEISSCRDGRELRGYLGHRRLRVIDVSEAAYQPMASSDGTIVLSYNGEVYNFRELRRELTARGYHFRSSGDTEVVLRAYEEWGEECIQRLHGMFALAVWDARVARLLLARDRTGKKPLFYSLLGGRMTFASEIKGIRTAPWIETGPDLGRIPEYLTFGYVPNPATLYEGIEQVPPGCTVTYDAEGLHAPLPYWDSLPAPESRYQETHLAQDVACLLRAATETRLIADVPLGAFLSGGVDSSIVVGLMARASAEPVRTFSMGFADEASFDERSYARLVAERFGTEHTEFVVRADAVALLDTLLWHHDQPFHDSSAIPTYLVSQLAAEHVKVVLNGDGGDEVFGGYDRFVAARLSGLVPPALGRVARAGGRLLPVNHGYYSPRRRVERFFELAEQPLKERYMSWIAVFNRDLLGEVLQPLLRQPDVQVTASMRRCYERASSLPELDAILYANFKTYLPDDLAVKMDRMSMAHSLETRSPFLDTALIERLARVPASRKVGLRRVKPLLREALRPLLPDEIWDRKKHGFGVPMGRWFRGELGERFEDEVLAQDAKTRELLNSDAVRALWLQHRSGERENGFRLWTLLTLERWLRVASEPQRAAASSAAIAAAADA